MSFFFIFIGDQAPQTPLRNETIGAEFWAQPGLMDAGQNKVYCCCLRTFRSGVTSALD